MFSVSANTVYAFEDGKHSLEVSYEDSDGVNVGAYAEGEAFENVIEDAIDQIEAGIAEFEDDKADIEESQMLEQQIADLQNKIEQLNLENEQLKARYTELKTRQADKRNNNFWKIPDDFVNKKEVENIFKKWGLR